MPDWFAIGLSRCGLECKLKLHPSKRISLVFTIGLLSMLIRFFCANDSFKNIGLVSICRLCGQVGKIKY